MKVSLHHGTDPTKYPALCHPGRWTGHSQDKPDRSQTTLGGLIQDTILTNAEDLSHRSQKKLLLETIGVNPSTLESNLVIGRPSIPDHRVSPWPHQAGLCCGVACDALDPSYQSGSLAVAPAGYRYFWRSGGEGG